MNNAELPAFPNKPYPEFAEDFRNGFLVFGGINPMGISKREYFAAMAMQGLTNHASGNPTQIKTDIEIALMYADQLLKELESPNQNTQ